MKNKILSIVLALMLVIALAGNVVLFNRLSEEKVNSNDYQEAMRQLVVLQTDLDHANETIATLQNKITDMENVISTNTSSVEVPAEEITAEMLEGLSADLTEEQQAAAEADKNTDNNSNNDSNNGNSNNNGNTDNNDNTNNSSNNTQPQPDFDWEAFAREYGLEIGTLPPLTEPEHEFGYDDGIHHGGRAQ